MKYEGGRPMTSLGALRLTMMGRLPDFEKDPIALI